MKNDTSHKPKAIWLFAGGPMQRVAAERIKARGYALIISDGATDFYLRGMEDEFVHADIFDYKDCRILTQPLRMLAALNKRPVRSIRRQASLNQRFVW